MVDNNNLKLYLIPESQPCRSVKALLLLGGVDFEEILVDVVRTREHHQPEFKKLSGNHLHVPLLRINDEWSITESAS